MRLRRNEDGAVQRGSGARPSKAGAGADSMFRAFADPTRLRILRLLQNGPLCVGDLVDILRAPQPTVSRHLAYLRRAGIVAADQHGLWMFYELAPARNALHAKLLECLAACNGLLPEVEGDVARARAVRRSGGCCPEGHRLMKEFQRRRSR
jgi:ArsR family transcriptional regulator